jgi:DNA-binding LytR/AlgR family response regulator
VISLQRLKTLEDLLPREYFFRIHNSYIVALTKIDSIHKDKIQIGEVFLPIGDTYKQKFREFVDKNHIR